MTTILLTGTRPERPVVERALYSSWFITEYVETPNGFVALIEDHTGLADPNYQAGRLGSFGSFGVKVDPTPADIIRAVFRLNQTGGTP